MAHEALQVAEEEKKVAKQGAEQRAEVAEAAQRAAEALPI